ncbi:hypothetical protein [Thermoflavimicrobium daqui]|uniref:DUF3888 domain-containing protein n=1 Tax=Thermoflavimicrobium daqui TaxID=2137476 RepID=A0A364K324_9BACL|nr:hypothetical protein [Thermoflavimicrobium daqui]RAL23204.1 hypothetical protein DL897_12625 [Thermoflavimicrobium daqui]
MGKSKWIFSMLIVFFVLSSTSSRSTTIPSIESIDQAIRDLKQKINKFAPEDIETLKKKQQMMKLPNKKFDKEVQRIILPLIELQPDTIQFTNSNEGKTIQIRLKKSIQNTYQAKHL